MPGRAPFVCVDRSTRMSRSSAAMRCAASRSVSCATTSKAVGEPAKLRRPFVVGFRQRIEVQLEARPVVMLDRRPHHLAHHVIAQVARQVADAHAPRAPRAARARQRLAVDARRAAASYVCAKCSSSAGSTSKNSSR